MAILLPSVARVTDAPMRLVMPNQTVLQSYYTAEEMVLSPAPGRFEGSHVISDIGVGGVDPRPQMESFLAKLQGRANVMSLPVLRERGSDRISPGRHSFERSEIVAGHLRITSPGLNDEDTKEGDMMCLIGQNVTRMYIAISDGSGGWINLLPAVLPGSSVGNPGTLLRGADARVMARLTENSAREIASHKPDYSGPWTLEWTEVV